MSCFPTGDGAKDTSDGERERERDCHPHQEDFFCVSALMSLFSDGHRYIQCCQSALSQFLCGTLDACSCVPQSAKSRDVIDTNMLSFGS